MLLRHRMLLRGAAGRQGKGQPRPEDAQPPETAAKRQSHCDREPELDEARNILIRLNPGDSVDEEITVSFYYDVRRTGTYTVQVSRHLPAEISKEDIPSNSVTFVVTE